MNNKREMLNLNRKKLSLLMKILTGHSILRAHLYRIGIAGSGVCRARGEDEDTFEHYVCKFPAFACNRVVLLSSESISLL